MTGTAFGVLRLVLTCTAGVASWAAVLTTLAFLDSVTFATAWPPAVVLVPPVVCGAVAALAVWFGLPVLRRALREWDEGSRWP